MIKKFIKGRTYVFIDASNMFYSQRTLGWNIDYKKLIAYLKNECNLVGIIVYFGKKSGDIKQQKFLDMLERNGYEVKTKEIKYIKTRDGRSKIKGNLDAEMIVDIVTRFRKFDTVILFSGDSDFSVVIDYLKSKKKRTLVASVKGHVARELLVRAKYINLKKLRKEISR